jgi:hypothetical protein
MSLREKQSSTTGQRTRFKLSEVRANPAVAFDPKLCCRGPHCFGGRTSILRASNLASRRIAFRYLARMPCQMRFALRSTLTLILIRMMMVMVAARSSAISGIIAGMLAFVHTFTIGAVNFSAVGFSDIFVTLSCNRILIAVLITVLVSAFITSSPLAA